MPARRGLFVAPFDELVEPRLLAELAAAAEGNGWDGRETVTLDRLSGGRLTFGVGKVVGPKRWARSAATLLLVTATVVALAATGASFASTSRRVTGPAVVKPGDRYTFHVSGFESGQRIYLTVAPKACRGGTGTCELDPCPSCRLTRVPASGAAAIPIRWPEKSLLALGSMSSRYFAWARGSRAVVDVDLASNTVPKSCVRLPSLTANPDAGEVVCAHATVRIG